MTKIFYLLLLITIGSLNAENEKKLVWPSPPDEARIEYISSVRSSEDLGIEKGFFAKLSSFILGEEGPILNSPFGLHADKKRIYVTDIATRSLYIFNKEKNELITINGSKKETFLYPIDVITDNNGNIFVSDSVRAKIYVFEENGDFDYEINSLIFKRPIGIAVSLDNKKLYISDSLTSQIHVTTLKGKFMYSIGSYGSGDGQFNKPTYIDVGNDGKLYVSDTMNHRVQVFDKDDKFIYKFGGLGQEIGSFGSPRGISVDSYGNIYVSDTMYNVVQIFNSDGELLLVFGKYGAGEGEFSLVEDIAITEDNIIYIADVNNKRFQIFKLIESAKEGFR